MNHKSQAAANTYIRICGRPGAADRPPMPSGHPVSWQLLTGGTLLDGSDYPYPVFDA